jgi:hypothetical protein
LSLFHAQKQIRQSPDLLCSFLRSGFTTLCVMATHRSAAVSKNLSLPFTGTVMVKLQPMI